MVDHKPYSWIHTLIFHIHLCESVFVRLFVSVSKVNMMSKKLNKLYAINWILAEFQIFRIPVITLIFDQYQDYGHCHKVIKHTSQYIYLYISSICAHSKDLCLKSKRKNIKLPMLNFSLSHTSHSLVNIIILLSKP